METTEPIRKAKGITVRLLITGCLLLICLAAFWGIADEIVLEKQSKFDNAIFSKLSFLTSPSTTSVMLFLTFFGSNIFLLPAYILLTAYFLFFRRKTKVSLNIVAVGLSGTALLFLMKAIFKRMRPDDPLIQNVTGFSFPSGHSFSAFTFFGLLIYMLWHTRLRRPWKYLWSAVFILFAACIAFSRVYLHVHYPSDVIAGFCLSILWLTISLWVISRINPWGEW